MDALFHARGLTKQFGPLRAVDGIDFDVARGEAFGFLGPNGTGKSSTMRMVGASRRQAVACCGCWAETRRPTAPRSGRGSAWCRSRTRWTAS
jgi:ABC-type Na+ transport system ATPase subunit NatA